MDSSALGNRLKKNYKKLKTYLEKEHIQAYRLYNKDIPEYPYLIDIYKDHAVIYEQGKKLGDEDLPIREIHQNEIIEALTQIFSIPKERQHFKVREKQKGNSQYVAKDPNPKDYFTVKEGPFLFLVNPEQYLDTGLFLDHRPLRKHLFSSCDGKKVLNLFSYTCSLSVASALGGGKVTSIDMSKTYLDWGYENFLINNLDVKNHRFIQADVLKELEFLKENNEKFDLILLDPPSFSNSKRMEEDLDIERDHALLVRNCMHLLTPGGMLYFSTNKRKFELHSIISETYKVKEITQWTIPQDFHQSNIHRAFTLQYK
jgi:23S rRNA (cytosine1962-C5)-methyltransferase